MKTFLSALVVLALSPAAFASYHLMQIEQVIGSLDGDTTAQAIQLRMRLTGENLVSNARVRVWDAAGNNPVLVLDMTTNVTNSAAGSRVLLATAAFTAKVKAVSPTFAPDFAITNAIPASYLAAGRLTYEDDLGTILWSFAWGGATYTGSNAGSTTNDADGNFGTPFGQGLPTSGRQGPLFKGIAGAASTTNLADYALSANPATVTGNNGTAFLLVAPQKIVVEEPSGTALVDGNSSVAFGSVVPGGSNSLVFIIKNSGNVNLTGLGITFGGPDAADFTVTSSPTSPVAGPSGSTNFTVRFAPASAGAKSAALHIASNDATQNPFDIGLTGTALTSLETWRNTWFGTTANTGDAANAFDFDNDGLVNLLEFALGLDPRDGTSCQLPTAQLVASNLVISFNQPAGVDGITYAAQYSTTLAPPDWQPIADTGVAPQHIFSVPASGNAALFMRLKVTAP